MLSALIIIPLIGAIFIAFFPGKKTSSFYRFLALICTSALLVLTLILGFKFDINNPSMQFSENIPWIIDIGLNYHLGLDGLSFPLIFINSLLTLITIYTSSKTIERSQFYYALILILNCGESGAFLAQDVILLFFFYELLILFFFFNFSFGGS